MKGQNRKYLLKMLWWMPALLALASCGKEEFVREAGSLPAPAGNIPAGALYAEGSMNSDFQAYTVSGDSTINVVFRLDYPAQTDVEVTLDIGNEYDLEAFNDAMGLKDGETNKPMEVAPFKRYRRLPDSNFSFPEAVPDENGAYRLKVEKGKTESAPLALKVKYDDTLFGSQDGTKRMTWPWMVLFTLGDVEGDVRYTPGQKYGIAVYPANLDYDYYRHEEGLDELFPREEPLTVITYCDCRKFDPSYAIYYTYYKVNYVENPNRPGRFSEDKSTKRYSPAFDVEILRPLFLTADENGMPVLQTDADLMYVLTHQARYMGPQRKQNMKICVSVETDRKSPVGMCSLDAQGSASLAWQIGDFLSRYGLDGVALDDSAAEYGVSGSAPADKSSYTLFLKELREVLGKDRLIMVSYDADENSSLYEEHDGLSAGTYIDYAWYSTPNMICTPYDGTSDIRPVAGLDASSFAPVLGECADTPEFHEILSAADVLHEMYENGQCSVLVYRDLVAGSQNFYEDFYSAIPGFFGSIPLREGGMRSAGWASKGWVNSNIKALPHFGGYGGGLKDW